MRIVTRETSPFPSFRSMPATDLELNQREIAALARAAAILKEAEDRVIDYCYENPGSGFGRPGTSDLECDWGISAHLFAGYVIDDWVAEGGLALPDKQDVADYAEMRVLQNNGG